MIQENDDGSITAPRLIDQSGPEQLIKAGMFFTVPGINTGLYTGDLFYNAVTNTFRISGVPANMAGLIHCIRVGENGPFHIDAFIKTVLHVTPPDERGYASIEFREAHASQTFMAYVEETFYNRPVYDAAQSMWTVSEGVLVWQK